MNIFNTWHRRILIKLRPNGHFKMEWYTVRFSLRGNTGVLNTDK